jgi:hypothetical protein
MDYMIVNENSSFKLQNEVRELLKHHWELQGGVSVSITYHPPDSEGWCEYEEIWAQALVCKL